MSKVTHGNDNAEEREMIEKMIPDDPSPFVTELKAIRDAAIKNRSDILFRDTDRSFSPARLKEMLISDAVRESTMCSIKVPDLEWANAVIDRLSNLGIPESNIYRGSLYVSVDMVGLLK